MYLTSFYAITVSQILQFDVHFVIVACYPSYRQNCTYQFSIKTFLPLLVYIQNNTYIKL